MYYIHIQEFSKFITLGALMASICECDHVEFN
jgi:hypothetical protein